ncbi:signal peptidase II [Heliobacterium chlorum]|uniref:Lipoprotein signal peptidase n=1 Tax=Heliobacterium chlorum TaxID=2698 RepID=A0ABR7SXM9_HELCL|nr:signal peptidase II [Heliobacterium chlorum]MBC9783302.1 signal peptidase II [Heliobacterium chlorum]
MKSNPKWKVSDRVFWLILLGAMVVDQWTKYIVQSKMAEYESIPIIPNIFHLTYILNPGAAFGMMANKTIFFVAVTIIVIAAILYFYRTVPPEQFLFRLGLALQAGGAVGNLIDRLRTGLVVDFFDFRVFPVFNMADTAITIGVTLILISLVITPETKDKKLAQQETVGSGES